LVATDSSRTEFGLIEVMMRHRLRVGVDRRLTQLNPRTGHGRVWLSVLDELTHTVDLQVYDSVPDARANASLDVIVADGHHGPVQTERPVLAQVHESSWDEPGTRDRIDPRFRDQIAAATAASVTAATLVVTAAESAKAQIVAAHSIEPDRVVVVPHGVDVRQFRPRRARAGRREASKLVGTDRAFVMYAGSVHPRKNIPVLRKAMATVLATGADAALLLALSAAADRPDSSELLSAASAELPGASGRIAVVQSPDDNTLADLMAASSVFCVPSESEGFGLTALEAMACGTAVVVADRGGLPEVVGAAGLCVDPTPDDLAAAIGGLLADPRRRNSFGRSARQRAQNLTWANTAAGWHAALLRAVEVSG
jgi:glycosyltransferase involved in cell wall biosynthesis